MSVLTSGRAPLAFSSCVHSDITLVRFTFSAFTKPAVGLTFVKR
jgi:hypothetical protein